MKLLIGSILLVFAFIFPVAAQNGKQSVSPNNAETFLRVVTPDDKTHKLKTVGLAKMLRLEVKGKTHAGTEQYFPA